MLELGKFLCENQSSPWNFIRIYTIPKIKISWTQNNMCFRRVRRVMKSAYCFRRVCSSFCLSVCLSVRQTVCRSVHPSAFIKAVSPRLSYVKFFVVDLYVNLSKKPKFGYNRERNFGVFLFLHEDRSTFIVSGKIKFPQKLSLRQKYY